ncbi:c-type cytochrome [Photobacterium japonica]|uniref:c-type cytochrome n=1 Tax=Photobacterium japonica TaxID=2910235 RepID=UPI003D0DCF5A
MKNALFLSLFALLSFPAFSAMPEGNADIGKNKAFSCQFCHGTNGVAMKEGYPHINGQNALYLYKAMKAYQDGERLGTYGKMMQQQLSALNDQDLADVAAFYTQQP